MSENSNMLNGDSFSLDDQKGNQQQNLTSQSQGQPQLVGSNDELKNQQQQIQQQPNQIEQQDSQQMLVVTANDQLELQQSNSNPQITNKQKRQKIEKLKKQFLELQEQQKNQVIHVETVGMMTKYQLVFIKVEIQLIKLAALIKIRESKQKIDAFKQVRQFSFQKSINQKLRSKTIYLHFEKCLNTIICHLDNQIKCRLSEGFKRIEFNNKLKQFELKIKTNHEKQKKDFLQALSKKDKDQALAQTQYDQVNNKLTLLKNQEDQIINKFKLKEKQISQLESEIQDIKKSRKHIEATISNSSSQAKFLEQKLKELENENVELKDKSLSTENNVTIFIKEMSEILDSHELSSLNLGLEDNNFLNNSNQIIGEQDDSDNIQQKQVQQQPQPQQCQQEQLNQKDKSNLQSQQNQAQQSPLYQQLSTNLFSSQQHPPYLVQQSNQIFNNKKPQPQNKGVFPQSNKVQKLGIGINFNTNKNTNKILTDN